MSRPRRRCIAMALAAIAIIVAQTRGGARADPARDCPLDESAAPRQSAIVPAVMIGMATPEEVERQTQLAEKKSGAPVSPAYVSLPRIIAAFEDKNGRHQTIAAILDGRFPKFGDHIQLESRHRDPNQTCNFVPWTVVPASVKADAGPTLCLWTYRKTRDPGCLDEALNKLHDLGDAPGPVALKPDESMLVGFLAAVIQSNPQLKSTIVGRPSTLRERYLFSIALCWAGEHDEARTMEFENDFALACSIAPPAAPPLSRLRPSDNVAENEVLFGAYLATGDGRYVEPMLDNLADLEDSRAADATRLGLMLNKFGNRSAANHAGVVAMTNAACVKYNCKADSHPFRRLVTAADGLGMTLSLGRDDKDVADLIAHFFDDRKGLAEIFARERAAFLNYLALAANDAAGRADENAKAEMARYEKLMPLDAAAAPSAPAVSRETAVEPASRDLFTPFERRRMTNDPTTNPVLFDFADPLQPPLAEALKIVQLADVLAKSCVGATRVSKVLDPFIEQNVRTANADALKDAEFIAHRKFQGLTYVELADLCAGIDFLFGPKGVLLPDAVTAGTGEFRASGDARNPYVNLQ